MDAHNAAVAKVAARVKHFHALQQPFRIYHGSTNSTRASPKSASNTVDTSRLANVLAVDPARRTATAEPNVPLGARALPKASTPVDPQKVKSGSKQSRQPLDLGHTTTRD